MNNKEEQRIIDYYQWRKKNITTWNQLTPLTLLMLQSRERKMIQYLNTTDLDLSQIQLLDIGCGNGNEMRRFVSYGANPSNCFGIDLVPERITEAKQISPNMNFICQNAQKTNFENCQFDLITQFTCFSSILDPTMKENIAKEMHRILKPGGYILWYDMGEKLVREHYRGISTSEIKQLFPNYRFTFEKITLNMRLSKILIAIHPLLAGLLESLKWWNQNYIGLLTKEKE